MKNCIKNEINNSPLISIGMPVYNGEKFIEESLNSILSQSYSDFKLIISDNNSTDNTRYICEKYASIDSRITYVCQEKNIGAAQNFIFVFNNRKKTKYFMWAACDDSWSENWLELLISNFENSDSGLFGLYMEGKSQDTRCPKSFLKNQFIKFFIEKDASGKCYYSYALFKADVLIKSNMELMNISIGADQIYLLSLLRYGNLRFIDGCVFKYRVHDGSEASRQSKNYGGIKRVLVSHFPMDYYAGAICAVPNKYKFIILCLIPVKYFYEQIPKWVLVAKKIFEYLSVR